MDHEGGYISPEVDTPEEFQTPKEETAQMYLEDLNLDWEFMRGKQVLDLGAGLADFAQIAKQHGIAVTSVEQSPEEWAYAGEPPTDVPYVKTGADALPFADECVDLIVSRAGPLTIVDSKELFERIYTEARRVLKPGGELRFGPGPIHTAVIGWDRVLAGKSFESLSEEERSERIAAEAEKYLKEITPTIERRTIEHSDRPYPDNQYYCFVKPVKA